MTGLRRVQVTGDLFHPVVPEGAIYVGRPCPGLKGSRWANPWPVKGYGLDESLRRFRATFSHPDLVKDMLKELGGRDLACWCPLDQPCHADILLELVEAAV